MTKRRPLRDLFWTATVIVAVWTVVALFSSSEAYRISVDTGFGPSHVSYDVAEGARAWAWVIMTWHELIVGLLWATFTPFIIFIAERLPLVRPFRWLNAAAVVSLAPVIALIRAAVGGAVLVLVEGGETLRELIDFVGYSIEVRFHRNLFLTLLIFGVYNLVLAYRASAEAEREILAAKKQLANDELQRLRGAIQPRFFFAAIEAVKAQVIRSPVVADRMIVQFGAVLRKMLEFEDRRDISLEEELDITGHCLALEKTRTAGRFNACVTADESLLTARVPPLVLHTVVTSAVLVTGAERGELQISAWATDGKLKISVRSDDPRRAPGSAVLDATRARLRRLFADGASVETGPPGADMVVLTMPLVFTRRPSGAFRPFASATRR